MNIHEYQAKELLRQYGIAVPEGEVAISVDEAVRSAKSFGGRAMLKAQVHAGGRGEAGGVKMARNLAEVKEIADDLLGSVLVTHQTGDRGKVVRRLLIEKLVNIKSEYYVGLVVDRSCGRVALMASTEGGMEIEEVARTHPEKIFHEVIDPLTGLMNFQARKIAFSLGVPDELINKVVTLLMALYKLFEEKDCSVAEINPLVITTEGNVVALDAKLNFDDNALFRHKDILNLRDLEEEDPREAEATKHELSYIALDGNIGCMVNGAGLAMATLDTIKHFGGEPANFLDVGGGATEEKITEAFRIILSDNNVKGILVNIFGGILKCDVIAAGVVAAAHRVNYDKPFVVRLEGTNMEIGKMLIEQSGLPIHPAESLSEAAQKIIQLVS